MSPQTTSKRTAAWRFPRVSGDEPATLPIEELTGEFSPRERG